MSIEHRRVTKTFVVKDQAGVPMANTRIRVRQTNHAFRFGCNCFESILYVMCENEPWYKDVEKTVGLWTDVFNFGTMPFYWAQYEPQEGMVRKEGHIKAAEFLREKKIALKGHPLCWHTLCADWLMEYDTETILKKQLDRIEREVSEYKGVIDMWDVINEVVIMPVFDKYDNAVTRLCNKYGQVGLVKMVFEKAKECNPDAVLLLNDFNVSPKYEELISRCLDAGAPIDVIGIQSHQHQGYWGKEKLEDVLERFSKFGLPIHFTENTFVSGDLIPEYIEDLNDWQVEEWPSTPEGEARQVREMEEMYRILFEHPLVEAITNWDFRDGAWLGAPSGLIRRDCSVKPAYEMLKRLTQKEWHTDVEVMTDENGSVTVEGFKGEYEITALDQRRVQQNVVIFS